MPRLGSCHLWQLAEHGGLATFGQQLRKPWVILSDARCRGKNFFRGNFSGGKNSEVLDDFTRVLVAAICIKLPLSCFIF